jgi:hypothetical protein
MRYRTLRRFGDVNRSESAGPAWAAGTIADFAAAWVWVLTAMVYVLSGLLPRHFLMGLMPAKEEMTRGGGFRF